MKLSIVSYLDPTSSAKIRALQHELSAVTGSTASLQSWEPHITIGDGVEVDDLSLTSLQASIRDIASQTRPFQLTLADIKTMDDRTGGVGEVTTPYVIYVDVKVNDVLLDLVDRVAQGSTDTPKWYLMPQPYTPHCTLAFRDLSEEGLSRGVRYLADKQVILNPTIDHIALVEKLPGVDRELIRYPFTQLNQSFISVFLQLASAEQKMPIYSAQKPWYLLPKKCTRMLLTQALWSLIIGVALNTKIIQRQK